MQLKFRANGKLLISGEYAVLLGAKALAFPTRLGQILRVNEHDEDNLRWISTDYKGQIWFEACFDNELNLISTTDQPKALYLKNLLLSAFRSAKRKLPAGLQLTTELEFPNNWGLGSSSTLVHLIAQWAQADPMKLFRETSTGSGYDVACAGAQKAITYSLEEGHEVWKETELPTPFQEVLFVHLNQKQLSKPEVIRFLQASDFDRRELISQISSLTQQFLNVKSAPELSHLMDKHESIMAPLLQLPKVKDYLFSDFEGSVKSLGAWGGDFVMALGPDAPSYFNSKGFTTQFTLSQIARP